MATSSAPIEPQKLQYLGRAVDCRKKCEDWWDSLDRYAGDQVRDIALNHENLRKNTLCIKDSRLLQSEQERDVKLNSKVAIKPHQNINLGANYDVQRYIKKTEKQHHLYRPTRTATFIDDIKEDPEVSSSSTSNGFKTYYSKYEQELCAYILKSKHEEIEQLLDFRTSPAAGATSEDSVTRLNTYKKLAGEDKKTTTSLWQIVTAACISFLEKKQYTHYVYTITLGAERFERDSSNDSKSISSVGVKAKLADTIDTDGTAGLTKQEKRHTTETNERGRIESDDSVSIEEVIEVGVTPIFNLISDESPELKLVMRALLENYNKQSLGELMQQYIYFIHQFSLLYMHAWHDLC